MAYGYNNKNIPFTAWSKRSFETADFLHDKSIDFRNQITALKDSIGENIDQNWLKECHVWCDENFRRTTNTNIKLTCTSGQALRCPAVPDTVRCCVRMYLHHHHYPLPTPANDTSSLRYYRKHIRRECIDSIVTFGLVDKPRTPLRG